MLGTSKFKSGPFHKLIDAVTALLFFGMLTTVLLQILFRFVLRISVPWTEELSRILYVYIIFLGFILLESEDNSIKVTFLVDMLPYRPRLILQAVLNAFAIFFLVCLFIGSIIMYRNANVLIFGTLPFLNVSILYIPLIIACPMTIFYLIRQLVKFEVRKFEDPDDITQDSSVQSNSNVH